uniref:Uncharacterized protein n=1 Tax=Ditylenchus dipsaci TaxID=166011 RepID=A0A915DKM3_9BILA
MASSNSMSLIQKIARNKRLMFLESATNFPQDSPHPQLLATANLLQLWNNCSTFLTAALSSGAATNGILGQQHLSESPKKVDCVENGKLNNLLLKELLAGDQAGSNPPATRSFSISAILSSGRQDHC